MKKIKQIFIHYHKVLQKLSNWSFYKVFNYISQYHSKISNPMIRYLIMVQQDNIELLDPVIDT